MPKDGALTLADLDAGGMLRVACRKCGRAGRLRVAGLIDKHGRDARLPDVLRAIVACDRQASMIDPCGAFFPDLAADQ